MRMKNEFILRGAKPVNTTVDGKLYDSTKIFIDLPLTDGNGNATQEYSFADNTFYHQHLANIELPVPVILDFEIVSTGKGQKTVIHGLEIKKQLKPVNQV